MAPQPRAPGRLRTAALVNLAMVVEQANEQVLPAVYLFVGRSLNATPVQLGTLTLCRAMVQTLASPLSGILGDRFDRVLVLSSGAFIWGMMTSAMALTVTLQQAMAFAGFNGLGLALLVPCCQSLVADLYPAEQRGRAFGTLQLTASLGGMMGGVFATNVGGLSFGGMEGWRFAFHCIAALSLLVGGLALFFATDPRRARGGLTYLALPSSDVTSLLLPPGQGGSSAASGSAQATPGSSCSSTGSGGCSSAWLGEQVAPAFSSLGSAQAAAQHEPASAVGVAAGLAERRRSLQSVAPDAGKRQQPQQQHEWARAGRLGDAAAPSDTGEASSLLYRGRSSLAGEQLLLPPSHEQPGQGRFHTLPSQHPHQRQQHQQHQQQRHGPLPAWHQQQPEQQPDGSPLPAGSDKGRSRGRGNASGLSKAALPAAAQQPRVSEHRCDVRGRAKGGARKRGLLADIAWMLRIKTFQAIVLQGIVGCFPWQAMVFFTLWLQLNGFSDSTASLLVAMFGAGVAGGALLGGAVGDRMARRLPNSGRIFTAQFSVACGIPLTWLLLKGLPSSSLAASPGAFGAALFVMGLTCTWAGAGCNSPIFAEIVPDELRSTIYAFDRSFENSIAACAAPVVGLLAERVFGFSGVLNDESLRDEVLRRANAAALGSSLLACMALPWCACLVLYSLLHWFYPPDRARAAAWAGGGGAESGAAYIH